MKALITGGTGFVGTNLTRILRGKGHEVTVLARNPQKGPVLPDGVNAVAADCTKPGPWQTLVPVHDVLINLAGVSPFKRWDDVYKKLLYDTRILTTRNLVDALPPEAESKITLVSTSGIGFYGFTGDQELDETAPPGDDFFAHLAADWEAEAFKAKDKGVRVIATRFGVVLGKNGGALQQMVLPFKFFVGGPVGNGQQWAPWIHIEDLCRAHLFLIENQDLEGPFNYVAPDLVRNAGLAKAIGKTISRPWFIPAPAFMIKLVLGEFGNIILEGQKAIPKKLLDSGFSFKFPELESALKDILVS